MIRRETGRSNLTTDSLSHVIILAVAEIIFEESEENIQDDFLFYSPKIFVTSHMFSLFRSVLILTLHSPEKN